MQLSKEEYARKSICYGCSVGMENSVMRDNVRHQLPSDGIFASLVMPNSYPRDGIFNPNLKSIKDSYIVTPTLATSKSIRLKMSHVMRKPVIGGMRPAKSQSGLLSYRSFLEPWNLAMSRNRYHIM